MSAHLKDQRQYFAKRLSLVAIEYDGKIVPAEYNIIVELLHMFSEVLMRGMLCRLSETRKDVLGRTWLVETSRALINTNRDFRKEILSIVNEIENLPEPIDTELQELKLVLRLTRTTSGIPESRTTPLTEDERVNFPRFLYERLMVEARQLQKVPRQQRTKSS